MCEYEVRVNLYGGDLHLSLCQQSWGVSARKCYLIYGWLSGCVPKGITDRVHLGLGGSGRSWMVNSGMTPDTFCCPTIHSLTKQPFFLPPRCKALFETEEGQKDIGNYLSQFVIFLLHPITLMWHCWLILANSESCHASLATPMPSSTSELIKPQSIAFTTSLWLPRFLEPSSVLKLRCHQVPTLISLSIV